MNLSDAFTAVPPTIEIEGKQIKLRPASAGMFKFIRGVLERIDTTEDSSVILMLYIICAMNSAQTAIDFCRHKDILQGEIDSLLLTLRQQDIDAVDSYLAGVLERVAAAKVDVPDKQGKA